MRDGRPSQVHPCGKPGRVKEKCKQKKNNSGFAKCDVQWRGLDGLVRKGPEIPRRFKAWMHPGPRQKGSTIRRGSERWKAPRHRPATDQDA